MNSITLKNADGETIEVKRDSDGKIKIRHSDFDAESFGDFLDAVTTQVLGNQTVPISHGSIIYGKSCILSSDEVLSIREAIKKLC